MKAKPILVILTTTMVAFACLLHQAARVGAQPAVPPPAAPPLIDPLTGLPIPKEPGQQPEEPDPEEEKRKAAAKKKKKEEEEKKKEEDVKKKIEQEAKKMRDMIALAKVSKTLAAEGDPQGQYNLGVMYSNGSGVPLDYSEAFKWYQRSAKQWHPEAQYAIGSVYYLGQGAAKNKIEAYAWWNLAASQGIKAAIADREKLAQEMNEYQITVAQRITRGYIAEKEEAERVLNLTQKKVAAKPAPIPPQPVPEAPPEPAPKTETKPAPKAEPPPEPPAEPKSN